MPSKIDASARKLAEFGNASTHARNFRVAMRAGIMGDSVKKKVTALRAPAGLRPLLFLPLPVNE